MMHLLSGRRDNIFLAFPHKLSLDMFKADSYVIPEVPLVLLFPQ